MMKQLIEQRLSQIKGLHLNPKPAFSLDLFKEPD